jgi:ankyrin repeat protein
MMSDLIKAIEINDIERVKKIVSNGIDYNEQNSPLGLAAEIGNCEVVRILVESGCKVEWGGAMQETPLYLATYEGHAEVSKFLISKHAKINAKGEDGSTALMNASSLGYFDIVVMLVEAGAKVNILSNDGDFALLGAASNKNEKICKYLLPLTSSKLIKKVDLSFIDNDRSKSKPSKEYEKLVDFILDINTDELSKNRDLKKEIKQVNLFASKVLDKQSVGMNGQTVVKYAVGKPEVLSCLLSNGFTNAIDLQDDEGDTPLINACFKAYLETVKILIDAGADVQLKNKKHENALFAVIKGNKSNQIRSFNCFMITE